MQYVLAAAQMWHFTTVYIYLHDEICNFSEILRRDPYECTNITCWLSKVPLTQGKATFIIVRSTANVFTTVIYAICFCYLQANDTRKREALDPITVLSSRVLRSATVSWRRYFKNTAEAQ